MNKIITALLLGFYAMAFAQTKDTIKSNENHQFQLDEVVVSTAFNKLQSQNVMKVEHQKTKDLQKKGALTLVEGIALIPGVSQISTGVSIGKPVIRGLSSNRIATYAQGIRLENQQFGEEHGLGLNDAGIESVEVIKGPASLLYGSDAMAGVLYFNPEKFAETNKFVGNFGQQFLTNTLGQKSTLGVKYSEDRWKFLARGAYDAHADYKIHGNEQVENSRFNESDFKTAIGFVDKKVTSTLRYNYNKLNIGLPAHGHGEEAEEEGHHHGSTSKNPEFPKQEVDNHIISINNIFSFEKSKIETNFGYIFNDRKEFEDSNVPVLHLKLKTLNYDFKYFMPKSDKSETIIGFSGMNQDNNNFGEEFLIPNATTNDIGVFGTTNYNWNKNAIQFGLRFDNRKVNTKQHLEETEAGFMKGISKNFNSINAMAGYKYNFENNFIFRFNLATGFRAPNLSELSSNGVHEGTNRFEIGNSELKPEQNIQTDINFEYKNSHFEFFVNGFNNSINNYIYLSPTGNIDTEGNGIFEYLQNNANLYGGEVGIHLHPHPLDWLHFESSFETVTAKRNNGENLPLIPANRFNNTFRTDLNSLKWLENGYLSLNVITNLAQNNVSIFETRTNDYTLVNFALGGKVKLFHLVFDANINANNIFNKEYIAHLSRLKGDGIPNIGRNIIFGINFNF